MKRVRYGGIVLIIIVVASLLGCAGSGYGAQGEDQAAGSRESGEFGIGGEILDAGPGAYDSADTAVLVSKAEDGSSVTLQNILLEKQYTLSVEGTSVFLDKYGDGVSLAQIEVGSIVDVTFMKTFKRLTSMKVSPEAWVYEEAGNYQINPVRQEISVGSKVYKYSGKVVLLSGNRQVEMMDLNPTDLLTIRGVDSSVLSVRVARGHGYLRLLHDESFIGGWIEIGQTLMQKITEDMLLTVPEGVYPALISNNGGGGEKMVVIRRNEETELDIGDLTVPEPQSGTVLFTVSPEETQVFIDGTQADISEPVTLLYGVHQLIAKAEGYVSITKYLRVGEESAGVDIVLDPVGSVSDNDSTGETEEIGETEDNTTASYYQVYVDAPEGAEVYLDGNYVGISPCSFKKKTGSHTVTLRRSGFETRSYTIMIDDEEKDISYSFADLLEAATVSGS
jgi:hypothetical protein